MVPPLAESRRREDCSELADYLWNNYIEVGDSSHIFFLGVGNAYYGLTDLFRAQPDVLTNVDKTIGFVCENELRGVYDPDNDMVARDYYRRSLVFVTHEHPCWDPDRKKPKRRHGQLRRSEKSRLQEMLHAHREEVWNELESAVEGWREEQKVQEVNGPSGIGHSDTAANTQSPNAQAANRREFDERAMDVDADIEGGSLG